MGCWTEGAGRPLSHKAFLCRRRTPVQKHPLLHGFENIPVTAFKNIRFLLMASKPQDRFQNHPVLTALAPSAPVHTAWSPGMPASPLTRALRESPSSWPPAKRVLCTHMEWMRFPPASFCKKENLSGAAALGSSDVLLRHTQN